MNKYSDLTRPKTVKSNKLIHQCTQINMRTGHSKLSTFRLSEISDRAIIQNLKLSNLTSRQNKILSSFGSSTNSRPYKPGHATQRVEMRTEKDFQKLLTQLDAIILNKQSHQSILLTEGKAHEEFTEEGSVQYYRIEVLGKRCPLKVEITRFCGNLRIFYSKNESEPSRSSHDGAVKQDSFTISDPGIKFKTEFIGISVLAKSDSNYTISIRFESQTLISLPAESPVKLSEKILSHRPRYVYNKNFLKLNKTPIPLNSPRGEHMIKFKDWKQRREMVVVRKQELLSLKKQRTLMHINRNATMKEEAERARAEAEEQQMLEDRQRLWLKLINFVQVTQQIRVILKNGKYKKIHSFRKQGSVRKIQKLYRCATRSLDSDALNINTCREILALFAGSFRSANQFTQKIVCFAKQSADNNKPHTVFMKIKDKVELIQKVWKMYRKKNKERWDNLINIWNIVFERIELNRSTSIRKKRNAKKFHIVSKEDKNMALSEYFVKKKKEYLANVKMYFITQVYKNQAFPEFKYLPSETQMFEIINALSY